MTNAVNHNPDRAITTTMTNYETADSYFYLVDGNLESAKAKWSANVKYGSGGYKLANRTIEASMVKLHEHSEHTHCLLLKKKK